MGFDDLIQEQAQKRALAARGATARAAKAQLIKQFVTEAYPRIKEAVAKAIPGLGIEFGFHEDYDRHLDTKGI